MRITQESEVSCRNCVGACCRRGVVLRLTKEEAEFLEQGGSDLEVITEPAQDKKGQYETFSDCGYLILHELTGMGNMYGGR